MSQKKAPESAHLSNDVSFDFSSSKLKIIKVRLLWWLIVFTFGCLCGPVVGNLTTSLKYTAGCKNLYNMFSFATFLRAQL